MNKELNGITVAMEQFIETLEPLSNVECFEMPNGERFFKHANFGKVIRVTGDQFSVSQEKTPSSYFRERASVRFYGSIYLLVSSRHVAYCVINCEGGLRVFFKKENGSYSKSSLRQIVMACPDFLGKVMRVTGVVAS